MEVQGIFAERFVEDGILGFRGVEEERGSGMDVSEWVKRGGSNVSLLFLS